MTTTSPADVTPLTPAEIAAFRQQTPGTAHVAHLNNAGAALPPACVTEAMVRYLREEATAGAYEACRAHASDVEGVYAAVAELLHADVCEVALVENATVAWQQALGSVPLAAGDKVACCQVEYHANYIPLLQMCKRVGISIEVVPDSPEGVIDVRRLDDLLRLDARVKLVVLTHVASSNGLVNPAEEVGKVTRKHGVLYLLDACQSVGQLPVDVRALQCDLLAASGRKFLRGPRGTGFLYVRHSAVASQRLAEPLFLDGHAARWVSKDHYEVAPDARRYENWEFNYAAVLGLGEAVRYALKAGLPRVWQRVQQLAANLRALLRAVPGVTVQDRGPVQCGIVTFTVGAPIPLDSVRSHLHRHGVNVSVSTAPSALLDLHARGLPGGVLRASVHYYNTEDELGLLARLLQEFLASLSKD